jgi:GTP-binding protein Era
VVHALNKIDIAAAGPTGAASGRPAPFGPPVPISALKQTGLDALLDAVVAALPVHPAYYDEETVTDRDERFFVCEIVREKIFDAYREEIPYSTTVHIVEFKEKTGKDLIRVEIVVERESQKGIIIGGKGKALKVVGEKARADIEKLLDRPVFLELRVKVREKWRDTPAWVKRFGYTRPG